MFRNGGFAYTAKCSVILRASKHEVLLLIHLFWCGFGGVQRNKLEM